MLCAESSMINMYSSCTNDDASRDNFLTSAEKKKITRAATKEIIAALDALLPPARIILQPRRGEGRTQSCGAQSFGRTGRSLIAILQDAAAVIKIKRAHVDLQTDSHFGMRKHP